MLTLIICLLLGISPSFVSAKNIVQESPTLISSSLEGEEKLQAYHKLQQLNLYESKDWYYNDFLLNEARKQGNVYYEATALTNRVAYYYRSFDNDSVFYYAEIAEKFAIKHNSHIHLSLVKEILIRRYLEQGHFSLGLKEAMKMYEEASLTENKQSQITALLCLSTAYQSLGQHEESIHYAKEALKITEISKEKPYVRLQSYALLISAYQSKGDKRSLFLYTDSLCNETEKVKEAYPIFNLRDFELSGLFNKAYYYIEANELDLASAQLQKADNMMHKEEAPYFLYLYNSTKMRYHKALKEYDKMIEYYDISYQFCEDNHLENETRNLLRFKAKTLSELKSYDKSVAAYKDLLVHIDSVNRERFTYEINQLRIEYELDKSENEIIHQKEQLKSNNRFIISLIFIVLFLLCICLLSWYNIRVIRKKNTALFKKIKALSEKEDELSKLKSLMKENIYTDNEKEHYSQDEKLFFKIEEFLNTEKPYIRSDYGRKELVSDMLTNDVYLARAVKKGSGMTIHEYLNKKRIDHAKKLLLKNINMTIEAVASDSGFASLRNFYRLFKEASGMSPAQFRSYIKESCVEKVEIIN